MTRELPTRKPLRLKNYDYSQAGCYFVTICIKEKHELLGKIVGATVLGRPFSLPQMDLSNIGKIVNSALLHTNINTIEIEKYVIMPNHIHFLCKLSSKHTGDRGRSPLQMIIRSIKSYVTKQLGFSIWQKSFYDHIIRDESEYLRIWQYIDENPIKWTEDKYFTQPLSLDDQKQIL